MDLTPKDFYWTFSLILSLCSVLFSGLSQVTYNRTPSPVLFSELIIGLPVLLLGMCINSLTVQRAEQDQSLCVSPLSHKLKMVSTTRRQQHKVCAVYLSDSFSLSKKQSLMVAGRCTTHHYYHNTEPNPKPVQM